MSSKAYILLQRFIKTPIPFRVSLAAADAQTTGFALNKVALPNMGFMAPRPVAFGNVPILALWATEDPFGFAHDFSITLDLSPNPGQSFSTSLRVVDSSGVLRTYTTAAASYDYFFGNEAGWHWGDGTDPVWTPGDVGNFRSIILRK